MPGSGESIILVLGCVLVFSYLLSANGTPVHSVSQANTRKKAVTHTGSSVMGIVFNCVEQNRIDFRTNIGVESTATDPLSPYFTAPTVGPFRISRFAVSHPTHVSDNRLYSSSQEKVRVCSMSRNETKATGASFYL